MERSEADIMLGGQDAAAPSAPRPMANGNLSQLLEPRPNTSLTNSPAPFPLEGDLNSTQLSGEYNSGKAQLEAGKQHNEQLSSNYARALRSLNAKKSEIDAMAAHMEQLDLENDKMSLYLDGVVKERDQAKEEARKLNVQAARLVQEIDHLRQQLHDLSSQAKALCTKVVATNKGVYLKKWRERNTMRSMRQAIRKTPRDLRNLKVRKSDVGTFGLSKEAKSRLRKLYEESQGYRGLPVHA